MWEEAVRHYLKNDGLQYMYYSTAEESVYSQHG